MPATKTLKRRKPKWTPEFIRSAVRAWLLNDDAVKKFGAAKEEGRVTLLDILQQEGEKDEKGSFWMQFGDDPIEGRVKSIKAERRVSKILDPEAAETFLKGKKLFSQCTETVTILSEEKILGFWYEGKITDEELASIFIVNETFAFIPGRVKL